MFAFTDAASRRWNVSITITSARQVRALTGIQLLKAVDDPSVIDAIASDPITLVDVLWALVKPAAEAKGVTELEFADAMSGDVIESATSALLEALVDFFPAARRRVMRRILDRATEAARDAETKLTQMAEDGTLDREIEKALSSMTTESKKKSGESPEPPASIPAP